MRLNEYLIKRAESYLEGTQQWITPQMVLDILHGKGEYEAMAEYLVDFESMADLKRPYDD